MAETILAFDRMLTDQPAFRNRGVLRAHNVVPRLNSYGPFKEFITVSNAIESRALGMISARDASNNVYVYAGTASKLYEMVDNTFTDESKGGGYTVGSDDTWEFIVWDDNSLVVATNFTDAIQSMAIGGGGAGAFADMITSTNKPKAKHMGVVHRFLVLGNTSDASDGHVPHRVWWSGIGDETDFDPNTATQCDFEDLVDGGWVQRVLGYTEHGIIMQTNAIRRMQYIGGREIFEFIVIDRVRGTPIPGSVIAWGQLIFFVSEEGFFVNDGRTTQHIGNNQVDRSFWSEFDILNKRYVSASVDPLNKLVTWIYPAGVGDTPNKMLMCKWDDLRWSEADIDLDMIAPLQTQGYTLDGLDAISTDIDTGIPESLDSDIWKGGKNVFGGFNSAHILAHSTGANRSGYIETGDIQPVNGVRTQINSIRPLIDGSGDGGVAVASRTRLKDSVSYGASSAMNTDGECPVLSEGRYHRLRLSLTSSVTWSHVQGLEIDFEVTGGPGGL